MTATVANASPFIDHLHSLEANKDRAALAELRRGVGKSPGEVPALLVHVVPWLPTTAWPGLEDAYFLIATLFALHPNTGLPQRTNLGASFARLARAMDSGGAERRFMALLNCDRSELPDHLLSGVTLLRTHDIPVDWRQLLADVLAWQRPQRWVQRAWAAGFWGSVADGKAAQGESALAAGQDGAERRGTEIGG
jgi:CRISPR system Cascade subunit CasB